MKNTKIKLEQLAVKSFITGIESKSENHTLKGGLGISKTNCTQFSDFLCMTDTSIVNLTDRVGCPPPSDL
ncbi:MAG: pinensin family lanthipeptide [Cyclobacteriaceae bacterium]